ncbi:hypothetical protein CRYUN_Cryun34aG0077500 [Craigia yunnanensis]
MKNCGNQAPSTLVSSTCRDKRTLEPFISIYQQSFSFTKSQIQSFDPPPDAEPLNSSTHLPIPSISQADELNPSSNATSIDDQLSAPDKQKPSADNEAIDNGEEKNRKMCELYTRAWVKDKEYPIYKPGSCLDEAFDCYNNGCCS